MTGELYNTVIILGIITILTIVIFAIAVVIVYHIHKKELERLTSYEINVNATIDEEIPNILENFAQNIFTDYRLKHLDMELIDQYISDDKQKEIREEFTAICGRRLSPSMMDKLSLFWKREAITEVLADKIYLIVVKYVAEHNAVKQSQNIEKTNR